MFGKFQQMQEEMKLLKERMENVTITGEAGHGRVKVTMRGTTKVERTEIADDLMTYSKHELEDLILEATNRAIEQVKRMYEAELANIAKDFMPPGMPPGMLGMN